jgi:transposase InsO family protein
MPRGQSWNVELRLLMMQLHEQGHSFSALSREGHVPREVLSRWWTRYQREGVTGLQPHSRRPLTSPTQLAPRVTAAIHRRRRDRRRGVAWLAADLGVGHGTVQRALEAHGANRLRVSRPRAVRRYEKTHPGELVHIDIKYLPTLGPAPEFEFAAIDDYTREAVATIVGARTTHMATTFLEHVLATLPYPVTAVMTDNDLAFTMRFAFHHTRLTRFEQALQSLGIAHRLIRPRAPESNGKVERFIRTVDDECFAVYAPRTSKTRRRALDVFLHYYNYERAHLSLAGQTPVARREAFFAEAKV